MPQRELSIEHAKEQASHIAQQAAASPWVERLARLGYAAKGVVYGIVGVLAALAATGRGGATTDQQGALKAIGSQPFGKALLAIVGLGLIGYALWRFVEAAVDPNREGSDAKAMAKRIGFAISGLIYTGLALAALRLVLDDGGASGPTAQSGTARLLQQPFGAFLVGIVGMIVIGVGLRELYNAYTTKFREELNTAAMSPTESTWVTRTGRLGLTARGIVFGIIGSFLIQAALASNANKARGLDGALQALAQQSFGSILLGIVAIGLIAYGVYMLLNARYRRLHAA